jgi:ketosteroid isomerase-like protein
LWDEWFKVWETHRSEITGIAERGDSVLVFTHNWLRGRDGIELEFDNPAIFTLSRGRVTRMRDFLDEQAARAAFETREGG